MSLLILTNKKLIEHYNILIFKVCFIYLTVNINVM